MELKDVRYRGKTVHRRAHVPILDVEYDRPVDLQGCGPTYPTGRTRRHASSPRATTSARVPCMSASGQDDFRGRHRRGNFRGVAFYIRSRQPFIVSELAAGWYRYVSEWRLALTGMIRPRFGFNGVRNPCTCKPHHHHAYGRFAFDVDGSRAAWINRRDEHKETTQ